jgi:hypothetical protein
MKVDKSNNSVAVPSYSYAPMYSSHGLPLEMAASKKSQALSLTGAADTCVAQRLDAINNALKRYLQEEMLMSHGPHIGNLEMFDAKTGPAPRITVFQSL